MKLFNTICIEVSSLCNRSCKFCPVAYNTRPDKTMAVDVLAKVIDELSAMRYRGRVELYIYNEPTRNMEHLRGVIRELRARVPRACIMIATNGDYLRNAAAIMGLYEAGLNQLLINCYSPGLYAKRLPWLDGLESVEIGGSIYNYVPPNKRTLQMLDKSKAFGTGVFKIINRAGNIDAFLPALTQPIERMCVKPFRLLNINWEGNALVCCNDYHGEVEIGNVRDHTVTQLWNHPVLNEYRRRLLNKDRSLPLCVKCDCHSGAYPHMVGKPDGPFASKAAIVARHKKGIA